MVALETLTSIVDAPVSIEMVVFQFTCNRVIKKLIHVMLQLDSCIIQHHIPVALSVSKKSNEKSLNSRLRSTSFYNITSSAKIGLC